MRVLNDRTEKYVMRYCDVGYSHFQSDDSIDVFVANEVVGVSGDGGENDNKSGLFSCPAILPYGHSVSLSLCLPGALYIFLSV